jgi:L-alanine-DL-glutamate epimerase-like enolase superfamily enzyme
VAEAIRRVQFLEEEALVWVEEPTRADDFAGHARIAAECRTPIQIGENLWGPHDLTKSLSAGASDFVMLDAMRIGGITGWLRAISQLQAAGLPVSSHLFPEISAQLLACSPQAHWLEYEVGPHRSYSGPWKLKMVSRFRKRKPAAESRGTKTLFSATGFARQLNRPRQSGSGKCTMARRSDLTDAHPHRKNCRPK